MQIYQKLFSFPLGSVSAEGFLKQQMERGRDGICGHLHELEPDLIYAPYVDQKTVKAWTPQERCGWGAEISGNYWTGYIQFAYTLQDPEMKKTAEAWVDAMLKNQKEDGYLGTFLYEDSDIYDDYNAWGTSCAMRGLLAFYEATGRQDVFDAVYRCLLWFCDKWAGDRKTSYAGCMIVEPMILVYQKTGDERLRKFSEDYLNYQCRNDIFGNSYKQMLHGDFHYNSNHAAGGGTVGRIPALVYTATGKQEYLDASVRYLENIRKYSMQLHGGAVSMSEYFGPVGSTTETEYCSFAFYNAYYSYLCQITGEPKFGDYMEQGFYNGAQGARKKDERAIAYLSAPNQIYATDKSSTAVKDMQVYAPCYPVACCPVNAVALIPEFIRNMMLRDTEDNIFIVAYGPCSLHYKDIFVRQVTQYPFRENVAIHVDCDREFTLHLKIPTWSRGETILLNGEEISCSVSDHFAVIKRRWQIGDVVEIQFKADVEVLQVNDGDYCAKYPIAFKRGPLLYSYHIPERWKPTAGRPITPLPEGWSWFHVYPQFQEAEVDDFHEKIGLRKEQFSWNVAVDENLSSDDVSVEFLEGNGYVWENPMIRLHTHCYKAPDLCAPYQSRTFEPFGKYQRVTDKLPLVLEPYGCTNLRITYFPKADLNTKEK